MPELLLRVEQQAQQMQQMQQRLGKRPLAPWPRRWPWCSPPRFATRSILAAHAGR